MFALPNILPADPHAPEGVWAKAPKLDYGLLGTAILALEGCSIAWPSLKLMQAFQVFGRTPNFAR